MKILATTLGETAGDMLSMTLKLGYAQSLIITFSFFLIMLFVQLKSNKYKPALYWLVIVGTTAVGIEISDAQKQWLALSPKVKDRNLKDSFNSLFEGLHLSAKQKHAKMASILASLDMSLVDVLENSF